MKKGVIILLVVALLSISVVSTSLIGDIWGRMTGKAVSDGQMMGPAAPGSVGPTAEEYACMTGCFSSLGCATGDIDCNMGHSAECQARCNAYQPEPVDEGQSCMEECVVQGCGKVDFECQNTNKDKCEQECGMIKEPEAKSEEESCIRECVRAIDSSIMCQGGPEGETGGDVCQMCAEQCKHLYVGPCLDDEKLKAKQEACKTCEHCFGEPVMGDSGEGFECIVDVKCGDASGEFGDDPGAGQGIVERTGKTISDVVSKVADFFVGLFGGRTEEVIGA